MTPLEILQTRYPESAGWTNCHPEAPGRVCAAVQKGPWRVNLTEFRDCYGCDAVLVDPGDGDWTCMGHHHDADPDIAITTATERARARLRELLEAAP